METALLWVIFGNTAFIIAGIIILSIVLQQVSANTRAIAFALRDIHETTNRTEQIAIRILQQFPSPQA